MTPSTSERIATAPPLTETVNPVPIAPSASVTVTWTTSSSVTPKPAHRVPVGTVSFRPLAGAQVLNNGSPGLNASGADAPGRRSSSEPSVVRQDRRR
jgi:hypothetical protein